MSEGFKGGRYTGAQMKVMIRPSSSTHCVRRACAKSPVIVARTRRNKHGVLKSKP